MVKTWGTLRHSDHLGWMCRGVSLDERALMTNVGRSKTTGSDKAVPHRPVYIERCCYVVDPAWSP